MEKMKDKMDGEGEGEKEKMDGWMKENMEGGGEGEEKMDGENKGKHGWRWW